MTCLALQTLDWVLVGVYGALVVGVAWRAQRRHGGSEDFLLGGRRLPWWVLGMSIIATAFSTLSLLGWTWKGFAEGLFWLQIQAGELAAVVVVALVFLPWYASSRATTAYEVLERRFGVSTRWVASAMFHVQALLRAGIFLFATAKALTLFTDLSIDASILVVGALAMLYSCAGGLGAVVWTDVIQMFLIVGGVLGSIALIASDLPGGFGQIFAVVGSGERPRVVDASSDLDRFPSLLSSILAYGVLVVSVAATSQQPVQRYLACKDVKTSRRALALSFCMGLLVTALTLFLGVALYAWNVQMGGAGVTWHDGSAVAADTVFPGFIAERVPMGLAGVLVAAIFAAAMSSIDSTIHSMATATQVDFVERLRRRPMGDGQRLAWARSLTFFYGLLCVGAALLTSRQQSDLIDQLLNWFAVLSGPILGVFLLARFSRRPGEAAALLAMGLGYGAALAFAPPVSLGGEFVPFHERWQMHPIWAATVGVATTTLVGLALGASLPDPRATGTPRRLGTRPSHESGGGRT